MSVHTLTMPLARGAAVFLDIDGTLIDLAATPDAVVIPAHLPHLLRRLAARHGGALALISGRSLADIDAMFGAGGMAIAAEHGAILRNAEGQVIMNVAANDALSSLCGPLRAAVAAHHGTLLEEKRFGLVVHWRGAPQHGASLTTFAMQLAAPHPSLFLQPAHEAVEIRVHGPDKASAMEHFLRSPPFMGRPPVFVGDDLTDEPAIARATALGGRGLHVIRDFPGGPAAVVAWLEAALAGEEVADA